MEIIIGIIIALLFLLCGICIKVKHIKNPCLISSILTFLVIIICIIIRRMDLLKLFIMISVVLSIIIDIIINIVQKKITR